MEHHIVFIVDTVIMMYLPAMFVKIVNGEFELNVMSEDEWVDSDESDLDSYFVHLYIFLYAKSVSFSQF